MGIVARFFGLERNCFPTGREVFDEMTGEQTSDQLIKDLEDTAQNSEIITSKQKAQRIEMAQMLLDLKSKDPTRYAQVGDALRANDGSVYAWYENDNRYVDKNGPDKFLDSMKQIIANPEDAQNIVNKSFKVKPSSQVTNAIETTAPESQSESTSPITPVETPVITPAPVIKATPSTPPASSSRPRRQSSTEQRSGMAVSVAIASNNTDFLSGLTEGKGLLNLTKGFDGGSNGIQEIIKGFFQQIASMLQNGGLTALSNDPGQSMIHTMSKLTGTNPNVTSITPAGNEVALGMVRAIDRGEAANNEQYKAKTPQQNMGGMS